MKFLIFNLAVVSALAYLIWGNDNNTLDQISNTKLQNSVIKPVKSALKNIKTHTKEKLASLKQKHTQQKLELYATQKQKNTEKISDALPSPKPVTTGKSANEKSTVRSGNEEDIINVVMRPIPVLLEPDTKPVRSKQTERSPINSTKTVEKEPGSKFMTASERRRELNKLAREMELLFVDKLNM